MGLYGQQGETDLLVRILARLDHKVAIDVGAERGALAEAMLRGGLECLHAFEPAPENANTLRERFAGDCRVVVHELAVSDGEGEATLHLSSHPDGSPVPFGHTLLEREGTDEIVWRKAITVPRRSLGSLVEDSEIPERVGIVKIDTEGHDLAVVRGMGKLVADVVMVEHWSDLPHGLGRCPWTATEILAELLPRGFGHFAFVVHRGEITTLKWDDADIESGAMGNLVFVHDRVLAQLALDVLAVAGELAERSVQVAEGYMTAAQERLELLNELQRAAEERGEAQERLDAIVRAQAEEIEGLRRTAEERRQALERATMTAQAQAEELETVRQAAAERLEALETMTDRMQAQAVKLESLGLDEENGTQPSG